MASFVLNIHDIAPDGRPIRVLWDKMAPGDSVFVPCVNTTEAQKQMRKITQGMGWQVSQRVVIEDHILGVRLWRTQDVGE